MNTKDALGLVGELQVRSNRSIPRSKSNDLMDKAAEVIQLYALKIEELTGLLMSRQNIPDGYAKARSFEQAEYFLINNMIYDSEAVKEDDAITIKIGQETRISWPDLEMFGIIPLIKLDLSDDALNPFRAFSSIEELERFAEDPVLRMDSMHHVFVATHSEIARRKARKYAIERTGPGPGKDS